MHCLTNAFIADKYSLAGWRVFRKVLDVEVSGLERESPVLNF